MSNAVAEHHRGYLCPVLGHRLSGLSRERALNRHRVQHDARQHLSYPADVQARPDCMQVGNRGSTGHQSQVGGACRSQRGVRGVGGGVDDRQLRPAVTRGVEDPRQARRVGRGHDRPVSFPEIAPEPG